MLPTLQAWILALVDIQLFGSEGQIAAAQEFAKQPAEHRQAQFDKLLSSLRNELRKELPLEIVEGLIVVLRPKLDNND